MYLMLSQITCIYNINFYYTGATTFSWNSAAQKPDPLRVNIDLAMYRDCCL